MLFQSALSDHDEYFEELAALLRAGGGRPNPESIAEIRARYGIEQLTKLSVARSNAGAS